MNIKKAEEWFHELRNNLMQDIESIETSKFIITEWKHQGEGGGKMSKIKGKVIEKGGVNISTVTGHFSKNFSKNILGTQNSNSYRATGISVVLHPCSPHIPSMHFNTRYLETEYQWFGGGIDITPCLLFDEENDYHLSLQKMCDRHDIAYYPKFKKWCDDYFYLPHRNESRGIGGIFFDNLNSKKWNKDFKDREKEEAKLNYGMELRNIENDSGQNGEASMHQQELNETQRQYDDAKQRGAGRQHLDELERRLIRVRGNLERARSQSTGDNSRRTSNAKMEYDRRVSQADRQLREQLSRMKQEMSREIGNIEREFGQQLRSQQEEAQRQQSDQQRMAREEQSQQKRMDMEKQREDQRFQQEEDRMKREMEMQDERMKREMQMDEQRMRMEEDRIRRMGQDGGPGMGMGPDGRNPEGMAAGVPMKTRGFLMNPKPGSQAQGFNAAMDPTMLAMIGIAITVLATGLTLFKGN